MPPYAQDEGLFPIPLDVLKLGRKHSIKGHNTWPRPSITDVNRALNLLGAEYCQDFDRVNQNIHYSFKFVQNFYFLYFSFNSKCVIF